MHQHLDCCTRDTGTAHFDVNGPVIQKNQPLGIRFYGWTATRGPSCGNPNGSGSQPTLRCNQIHEELDYTFGQVFRTHCPFFCGYDPIPLDPAYTAYPYDDSTKSAFFNSRGGTVNYYVPNVDDAFFANGDGTGVWWAHNVIGLWQTDWFWESMLREYAPDPLGLMNAS